MKKIEIDDELYQFIASQTQDIGESASSILRRLLNLDNHLPVISQNSSGQRSGTQAKNKVKNTELILTLIHSDDFVQEKKSVGRFLMILSCLYEYSHSCFSLAAADLHGSKRRYLATDETTLLHTGTTTKPREIPGTPYWVVTNNNTLRKSRIIEAIMQGMSLPESLIQNVIKCFMSEEHK